MEDDNRRRYRSGVSTPLYCLGFIGALLYFMQHASTFGEGVMGVLKAIVWPAVLVYHFCEFLKL